MNISNISQELQFIIDFFVAALYNQLCLYQGGIKMSANNNLDLNRFFTQNTFKQLISNKDASKIYITYKKSAV